MGTTYEKNLAIREQQDGSTKRALQERNRAYLLIVGLMAVIIIMAIALVLLLPLKTLVPVIATIDENTHVTKVQVVTPEIIMGNEMYIRGELYQFIINCNSIDSGFRQRLSDLCRLHATKDVAQQYDQEISPENPLNPYYLIGNTGKRDVDVTGVNILDMKAGLGQVTYKTITKKPGAAPVTEYWTATLRYKFTGHPVGINDRLENPLGFAVYAYRKDQELARN